MDFSLTPSTFLSSQGGGVALAPGSERRSLIAEIYVYLGQELLAKYAIEHGEYIIGRDDGCNITISAERVSRHHARLIFNAYEVVIEDLDSSNGVFIDGVQLQLPTRVYPDQEVQIGATRVFIHLSAESAKELRDSLWDSDLGLAPVRQQLEGARYKVLTTLARGGMGVVLQARDLRVRRTVAMKVMKSGAQFSKENVLRFIDEAQLTGQLDHPNIVPVYELGIDERGEAFYTMKYVKGTTLDEVLRGLRNGRKDVAEKYPLALLLTVFQKICDAIAFAHAKGVIHRDLKPENVMIGAYGEVLVMDWGLAKQTIGPQRKTERQETPAETKTRHPLRAFETMHGVVVGTPPFVSPEQARGETDAVDTRSDVWVLGAILYTILTLRAPVEGLPMEETLHRIIAGAIRKPVSFNQAGAMKRTMPVEDGVEQIQLLHCPAQRIPEGLSAIVMKAMETEAADRYQSVVELQADLTAHQGGFAAKAERASLFRQALLFGGRHKRELSIFLAFAILLQLLLVAFIIALSQQKNEAIINEKRAIQSEKTAQRNAERAKESEGNLAKALDELRGTAPTYAQEAEQLIDDQKLDEALEKIEYAIEQVPNEANYHQLRGNILQSLLRFNEALTSYNEALARNPKIKGVKENISLTKHLVGQIGDDGTVTQPILRELHAGLVSQKRVGEAIAVLDQIGKDRALFSSTWKAALEKRGVSPRFESREDDTLYIDLSKSPGTDLRKLRSAPVSGLNLDDTRVQDLSALKGLPLTQLSLNHTQVRDLSPLVGMPLHTLDLESTPVMNLSPLQKLPLEFLRMQGTKIESLVYLKGLKLEQLSIAGCRNIKDLTPLAGMPLQKVDLSRTGISELKPLVGAPIRELDLEGCIDLVDLTPLLEMKSLESVRIPTQCRDIAFLRAHPSIKRLSYKKMTQQVYDFWAEVDAKELK